MPTKKQKKIKKTTKIERPKCAFDQGRRCGALTAKQCKKCSFYKTPEELARGREKAYQSIRKKGLVEWARCRYSSYFAEYLSSI